MGTMRLVLEALEWGDPVDAPVERLAELAGNREHRLWLDIMVPNFVARIHGMNFEHMVPPAETPWGFVAVAAFLMIMVAWGFIHSKILGWL